MVKNLILDMGNVMIEFAPDHLIEDQGIQDSEVHAILLREVFRSLEWVQMDWGILTEQEAAARICARLPDELKELGRRLVFDWDRQMHPIDGMEALVRECKACGMGIYLLSNASVRLPDYWPRVPGSDCFDGITVSGLLGCVKPMPEIYRHVLDTYGLQPEECLFVDDMPMNVAGAMRLGIHGFVFRGDSNALREEIIRLGGAL